MKKRKLLFGSLAIAALATLAACGGGDNPTTTTPAPTTTTTVAPTTTPTPTTTPAPTTTPNPTTTPTTPTTPQVQTYTVTIQVSHGKAEDAFDGTAVSSISEIPAGTPISYDQETKIIKIGDSTQATSEAVALTADSGYLITGVKLSDGKDLPAKVEGNLTIVVQVEQEAAQTVTVTLKGIDPYDATKEATEEVTLDQTDATTGEKFGMLQYADPTNEYKEFVGWYLDADCTQEADATGITAAVTLYAKWKAVYETVTTGIGITGGFTWQQVYEAAGGTGNFAAQYTFPQTFTIGNISFVISSAKAYLEAAGDINTQGSCTLDVVLSGEGNNNSISSTGIKWSSSTAGRVYLHLVNADGTTEQIAQTDTHSSNDVFDVKWDNLPAGTYRISGEKSIRIYNLTVSEKKEKAPVSGIELVSAGETEYLVGLHTAYSTAGLSVNAVRANGAKEALDLTQLQIDTTAVDFTQAGEYTVTITYGEFEPLTHKVNVYAVDALHVEDYILNSSRVTLPLQTVYLQGEGNAQPGNLAVKAVGKLTTESGEKVCAFVLPSTAYQVTAPSLAEAGLKNFEIKFGDKTVTYEVLVTTKLVASIFDSVDVTVNKAAESFGTNEDLATVKTINQAMQLLELSELEDRVQKSVLLTPGTYNEKVEVKLPNVYLLNKGCDISKKTREEAVPAGQEAIIVYDALAGYMDATGHAHSTDGSATFSIRSTATDFEADGVTFKNYYNTHELYTESKSLVKDTQAVALLVEADSAIFSYCVMSSYHDTLYAREGRQWYYQCYIEGRTDYIFGDRTVSALFDHCVIHTLGANQDKNGGYVACNKGSNSEYGYIFDSCVFEADAIEGEAGVADATVSLGRTWDEKMRLYIVNSTISAAYAKADFGATTEGGKNTRYTEMNKGKSPSKALIKEYNNTGDGALTAQEAAEYTSVEVLSTFDVNAAIVKLFSSNANVTYPCTWIYPILSTERARKISVTVVNPADAKGNLSYDSVVGGSMTQAYVEEGYSRAKLSEGSSVVGFYSDQALTTPYNFATPFTDDTTIYVKVSTGEVTKALPTFNGPDYATQQDWTVTQAAAGTQKISPTLGGNKDSADAVTCPKFAVNDGIKNKVAFDPANKIELTMLSSSTGTSNAVGLVVNLYDAQGTLVKTETWADVTSGKVTTSATKTITSSDAFCYVEILFATPADKNFGIYSLTAKITTGGESQQGGQGEQQQSKVATFNWDDVDLTLLQENGKYYTDAACTTESTQKRYDQTAMTNAALQKAMGNSTAVAVSSADGASCTFRDGVQGKNTLYYAADKSGNNPKCLEIKNSGIDITFTGTGTIVVSFSSTGGSNKSRIMLVSGQNIYAASETPSGATLISEGTEAGCYEVSGTTAVTFTFNITEAGTYTLVSPSAETGRGGRITALVVTDNGAQE